MMFFRVIVLVMTVAPMGILAIKIFKSCIAADAETCIEGLLDSFTDNPTAADCHKAKVAYQCLESLSEGCQGEKQNTTEEMIGLVVQIINKTCDGGHTEIFKDAQETMRCLGHFFITKKGLEKVKECAQNMTLPPDNGSSNVTHACQQGLEFARCMSNEVGSQCDHLIHEPLFRKMMVEWLKKNTEAAVMSHCLRDNDE